MYNYGFSTAQGDTLQFHSEAERQAFEKFKGVGVYADLMLDYTFKKAFNPDTENKVCLIALLNALLEGEIDAPIRDVHSRDKEMSGNSRESRTTIFDIYCIDDCGRRFIIEMQIVDQDNIVDRAIFYAAQAVVSQGYRGRDYDYTLCPVFTVVFMEFEIFQDNKYVHNAKLRERNGKEIGKTLNFTFVEFPKFEKRENELETDLDKALYAMKHIKEMREMPSNYTGGAFELLFRTAKLVKLSKEELAMISLEQKRKWDEYAVRKHHINAMAKARATALAEGFAEGLEKGRFGEQCEIALRMKRKNYPIPAIADISGLSEEEIREL